MQAHGQAFKNRGALIICQSVDCTLLTDMYSIRIVILKLKGGYNASPPAPLCLQSCNVVLSNYAYTE